MAIFGIHPEICEDCGLTTKDKEELADHIEKDHPPQRKIQQKVD